MPSCCETCHYYGPHMNGKAYDLPWPCICCESGEKYVEKGTKPKRKNMQDRIDQLENENHLLRAALGTCR